MGFIKQESFEPHEMRKREDFISVETANLRF